MKNNMLMHDLASQGIQNVSEVFVKVGVVLVASCYEFDMNCTIFKVPLGLLMTVVFN